MFLFDISISTTERLVLHASHLESLLCHFTSAEFTILKKWQTWCPFSFHCGNVFKEISQFCGGMWTAIMGEKGFFFLLFPGKETKSGEIVARDFLLLWVTAMRHTDYVVMCKYTLGAVYSGLYFYLLGLFLLLAPLMIGDVTLCFR